MATLPTYINHGGAATCGPLTNRSGSIAAGGTAQDVAAENVARRYFLFQNISAENAWINFGSDAVADQPSIKIPPGGSFEMAGSFIGSDRISVLMATTSSKFVAKEG